MCCIAGALAIGIVLKLWLRVRGRRSATDPGFAPAATRPGPV
jgi:hypothetical protein